MSLWQCSKYAFAQRCGGLNLFHSIQQLSEASHVLAQGANLRISEHVAREFGSLRRVKLAIELGIDKDDVLRIGHIKKFRAAAIDPVTTGARRRGGISRSFPEPRGRHSCPGSSSAMNDGARLRRAAQV